MAFWGKTPFSPECTPKKSNPGKADLLREGAITQAKKRFSSTALEPHITRVEGDYTRDALPVEFDFVCISAIIHQMGRRESHARYATSLEALAPAGWLESC